MASISEFRKGLAIKLDGDIWIITEYQHVSPGNWRAMVRTRLKNAKTGRVAERTFRMTDQIDSVRLESREMQYLYESDGNLYFMDTKSYEQTFIPAEFLGEQKLFLKEGNTCTISFIDNKPITADLPFFIDCVIAEAEPGVERTRADTRSGERSAEAARVASTTPSDRTTSTSPGASTVRRSSQVASSNTPRIVPVAESGSGIPPARTSSGPAWAALTHRSSPLAESRRARKRVAKRLAGTVWRDAFRPLDLGVVEGLIEQDGSQPVLGAREGQTSDAGARRPSLLAGLERLASPLAHLVGDGVGVRRRCGVDDQPEGVVGHPRQQAVLRYCPAKRCRDLSGKLEGRG